MGQGKAFLICHKPWWRILHSMRKENFGRRGTRDQRLQKHQLQLCRWTFRLCNQQLQSSVSIVWRTFWKHNRTGSPRHLGNVCGKSSFKEKVLSCWVFLSCLADTFRCSNPRQHVLFALSKRKARSLVRHRAAKKFLGNVFSLLLMSRIGSSSESVLKFGRKTTEKPNKSVLWVVLLV